MRSFVEYVVLLSLVCGVVACGAVLKADDDLDPRLVDFDIRKLVRIDSADEGEVLRKKTD